MAAVLACGEGAFLTHRGAGALYGVCEEPPGTIEVGRRGPHARRHRGIRLRRRPSLPVCEVGTVRGIPVTSPVQTLIDLATVQGPKRLERSVNEADKLGVVDPEELLGGIESHAGEAGVKPLRRLLDRDTFLLSDDVLERLFLPLALESGLPLPESKTFVNGFEVDFFWPILGLVVETDGLLYHRTPAAQSRDALRDQVHTASGLTTLRFTHFQVKHEPDHVRTVLTRTAARLRPPGGATGRIPPRP